MPNSEKENYGGWMDSGSRAEVKTSEHKEMEIGAEQIASELELPSLEQLVKEAEAQVDLEEAAKSGEFEQLADNIGPDPDGPSSVPGLTNRQFREQVSAEKAKIDSNK